MKSDNINDNIIKDNYYNEIKKLDNINKNLIMDNIDKKFVLDVIDKNLILDESTASDYYDIDAMAYKFKKKYEKEYYERVYTLFLEFCGSDSAFIEENINFDKLIESNVGFKQFVKMLDQYRFVYLESLKKCNIDLTSPFVYELNKGEFDNAVSACNTIISPYASTLGEAPSFLKNIEGKLYRFDIYGNVEKIPEGSTFIIHNPFNFKELYDALELLSGTNNRVILGTWKTRGFFKDYNGAFIKALESTDAKNLINNKYSENFKDKFFIENIDLNVKNLTIRNYELVAEYIENYVKCGLEEKNKELKYGKHK